MKRQNQNSIVALATLGVYLGLLLAGATPGVLAQQAALTKQFNVKDEIERKDNLDKKPDGEINYVEELADLLISLNNISKKQKINLKAKKDISIEDFSICESDNTDSYLGFGDLDSPFGKRFLSSGVSIARSLIDTKVRAKAGEKYASWPQTINIRLLWNDSEVRVQSSIAAVDGRAAQSLNALYAEYLRYLTTSASRPVVVRIAEKTTSEVSDVKVILVTRLARSDLDPLRAADAK